MDIDLIYERKMTVKQNFSFFNIFKLYKKKMIAFFLERNTLTEFQIQINKIFRGQHSSKFEGRTKTMTSGKSSPT